jgi:putative acetyltransferase
MWLFYNQNLKTMNIRLIVPEDNAAIADVVRKVMTEYGADPKTTILGDPSLNTMYQNYDNKRSVYFVVENEMGKVVGGAGLKQLDGSEENICELQRMFLLPEARGKGLGKKLIQLCITKSKEMKYDKMYLESLSNMDSAIGLYTSSGFKRIPKSMGNTGHGGCDVFMTLDLK